MKRPVKKTTKKPSYADCVVAIRAAQERVAALEERVFGGPSTPAMPVSQSREAYCVIGDKSSCQRAIRRMWKKTEQDAAAHAAELLQQTDPYGNSRANDKLFVVKVVAVVHKKQPVTQVDVRPLDNTTQIELFSNR